MFVDTHCHLTLLDLTPYNGDLDQALAQAREAGVSKFMSISVDLDDHIELAKSRPVILMSVIPLVYILAKMRRRWRVRLLNIWLNWHSQKKSGRWVKRGSIIITAPILLPSKRLFCPSYPCLTNCEKPVVVHTRSAKHDTVDIIRAEKSTHGILHCFTEDWETAKAVLDCGYYVSFSGIVSFKMPRICVTLPNRSHLIGF